MWVHDNCGGEITGPHETLEDISVWSCEKCHEEWSENDTLGIVEVPDGPPCNNQRLHEKIKEWALEKGDIL